MKGGEGFRCLQVRPHWRLLAWGSCTWARGVGHPVYMVDFLWLVLSWKWVQKSNRSYWFLTKSWLLEPIVMEVVGLPGLVPAGRGLAPYTGCY